MAVVAKTDGDRSTAETTIDYGNMVWGWDDQAMLDEDKTDAKIEHRR